MPNNAGIRLGELEAAPLQMLPSADGAESVAASTDWIRPEQAYSVASSNTLSFLTGCVEESHFQSEFICDVAVPDSVRSGCC